MKVYTKTGDEGKTGLVGGSRVSKGDLRIQLYGEVDELNSFLGLVRTSLTDKQKSHDKFLDTIQNQLFDLGSNLACESEKREEFKLPQITEEDIKDVEAIIDELSKELPALKNFILPGGALASSHAHVCRVVCRRIERQLVRYTEEHPNELPTFALPYLNRLSDYFFVLARSLNHQEGLSDKLWSPKA